MPVKQFEEYFENEYGRVMDREGVFLEHVRCV